MRILIVEPFFTGSHQAWALGYQKHSEHQIDILSLSGHHWKWRMHGGAVSLAKQFKQIAKKPDLILATDMLDLSTFMALTREKSRGIPTVIYFHENQLTYPWSPTDKDVKLERDNHYAFINYTSALAADTVLFNSAYHRDSFLNELPPFLKAFPDNNELESAEEIKKKSHILHLGMDLSKFDQYRAIKKSQKPLIIWNHRWEYDKNPEEFFGILGNLTNQGLDFEVAILGESYVKKPSIFQQAQQNLSEKIVHFGFAESFKQYAQWLWKGDILPVTSYQDFFGGSVVEGIYCNCYPLLPNRLAYPEHIPINHHSEMLYENSIELEQKLAKLIINIDETRSVETSSFVNPYDWSIIAPKYDRFMENAKIKP